MKTFYFCLAQLKTVVRFFLLAMAMVATCCYDYLFGYDLCKGKGQLQNLKFLPLWSGFTGVFLHVRCIPHHNSIRQVWASVWSQLLFSRLYQVTSVQFFSFKAGVQAARPVLHQRRHWMSAGSKKQEEHGSRFNIFKYVIIIRPYAWPQGLYRTSDVLQSWLVFALQMAAICRVREITGHMYTLSGFFLLQRTLKLNRDLSPTDIVSQNGAYSVQENGLTDWNTFYRAAQLASVPQSQRNKRERKLISRPKSWKICDDIQWMSCRSRGGFRHGSLLKPARTSPQRTSWRGIRWREAIPE
jgi:hypothetical protein